MTEIQRRIFEQEHAKLAEQVGLAEEAMRREARRGCKRAAVELKGKLEGRGQEMARKLAERDMLGKRERRRAEEEFKRK